MPRYDSLQTLAYRFAPEVTSLPYTYHTLNVPEHWKSELRRAYAHLKGRSQEKTSVPYSDLNKALRTLVPELIAIEPRAWWSDTTSWLFCNEAVSTQTQAIFWITQAWAHSVFAKLPVEQRGAILAPLQNEDLRWQREEIDLAGWHTPTEGNGTAEPRSEHAFRLLPDHLAARLNRDEITLRIGARDERFRRAPLAPGTKGAELISWPPRMETIKGECWPFSYVISLTVQTVPFQSFPVLHVDLSLRRWCYAPITFLPGKEDTSVYLLAQVPWLPGVSNTSSFQVAPLRWVPLSKEERTAGKPGYGWGGHLPEILGQLQLGRDFFNAQQISADPKDYLNPHSGQSAAIAFRNGITPRHGMEPGITPKDRRDIAQQITELLHPEFVSCDPLPRVKVGRFRKSSNPFLARDSANENTEVAAATGAQRRTLICQHVGPRVALEIWYQQTQTHDALIRAAKESFGLEQEATFPFACPTTGLRIDLHVQEIGELAAKLDVAKSSTSSALHGAIRQRCEEVAARVTAASIPTVALIEIENKESFDGASDPKYAIRKAFAHTGRLTQFITIDTSKDRDKADALLEIRARGCMLDALRQLGVQAPLPVLPSVNDGGRVSFVGVWMIRKYAGSSPTRGHELVPVMVRIDGATGHVSATAPGLASWLPYREALLRIGRDEIAGLQKESEGAAFIQDLLRRELSQAGTLLLCHAQNLRRPWPWLGNTKLTRDSLSFGNNQVAQSIACWPGLRVIRIRDAQNHETPECYTEDKDASVGHGSGLYRLGERVFMGRNAKPKQQKRLKAGLSKFDDWTNSMGETCPPQIATYAWNAALCELTVACLQPGDDPERWAALANQLRRDGIIHYDEDIALPAPLHLAKLMEEYVLPVDEEE